MSSGTYVTFVEAGKEDEGSLFGAAVDSVPRVGESICYSHTANDDAEWNAESLADSKAISGVEWVVTGVYREYRRSGVMSLVRQSVWVYLKRTHPSADERQQEGSND
jgi:hypothetical protein